MARDQAAFRPVMDRTGGRVRQCRSIIRLFDVARPLPISIHTAERLMYRQTALEVDQWRLLCVRLRQFVPVNIENRVGRHDEAFARVDNKRAVEGFRADH